MNTLTLEQSTHEISPIAKAGQVANAVAARHVFSDYILGRPLNTLSTQRLALKKFAEYLFAVGAGRLSADNLQHSPGAWHGVTWGLVKGFYKWCLSEGYAVSTAKNYLSSVKVYAGLAHSAGVISADESQLIRKVSGDKWTDVDRINKQRDICRVGAKKSEHVSITLEQARALRNHPDTPQGRRDALLMRLLLDHGLRAGEVEALTIECFDLERGEMTFDRPKVKKKQTHRLTYGTLHALKRYIEHDAPKTGVLLRGSRRGGKLTHAGMKKRSITARVQTLGKGLGIPNLSAHDCRHYWATDAARSGSDPFALQEAGGWSSLAMPRRYVEAAKIANEKIKQSE